MKRHSRWATFVIGMFFAAGALLSPPLSFAQWPFGPGPVTPQAQRNAVSALRSQIKSFQNTTRTAPNYGPAGYENVLGQFESVRGAYQGLKQTLNPNQLQKGANAWAELDAGLGIISEAFTNYQNDIAAGREARTALRDMCEVLREAVQVWAQEMDKTCSRLRVGFG